LFTCSTNQQKKDKPFVYLQYQPAEERLTIGLPAVPTSRRKINHLFTCSTNQQKKDKPFVYLQKEN